MIHAKRSETFSELRADILRLQGFKTLNNPALDVGLAPMKDAFPQGSFPLGCVHEFLSSTAEDAAATTGFVSSLLSALMATHGTIMWIGASRKIFPPALKNFGIQPDRVVFVDVQREKDVIWAVDEALKCGALSAVVGEVSDVQFTASRRFQLAVEQSEVTGFLLRHNTRPPGTTACVSRWKITSLPSEVYDQLPGVGFPRWRVELLRMRNGRPGVWNFQWVDGRLVVCADAPSLATQVTEPFTHYHRNAG